MLDYGYVTEDGKWVVCGICGEPMAYTPIGPVCPFCHPRLYVSHREKPPAKTDSGYSRLEVRGHVVTEIFSFPVDITPTSTSLEGDQLYAIS